MSIRMAIAIASGLCAAVALAGTAGAEMAAPTQTAPKPKTVTVTGCPTAGFPALCTMIKGKGGNYNVSSANPAAPIGKKVRLKGTVTDKHSICGGLVLDNVTWQAVKGKCPAPAGQK